MSGKKTNKFFLSGGPRNILIGTLVLLGFLFVLHTLTDRSRTIKTLTYSTFLNMVEQGEVKRVHATGNDLYGILKDGSRFETTIANKSKDWELLRAHGVEFSIDSPTASMNIWYLLSLLSLLVTAWAVWYRS